MAGISNLKAAINKHGGLSRLCKYRLDFSSIPRYLDIEYQRNLDFFLEGITVPGKTLSNQKFTLWDKQMSLPTAYEDDDLTLSFMMPNDNYIRSIFYNWIGNIIDNYTNTINYYNNYTVDLKIYILNDQLKDSYEITCTGAYPTSYSSTAFSASSTDYAKLEVRFAYHKIIERPLLFAPPSGYKFNYQTGRIESRNPTAQIKRIIDKQGVTGGTIGSDPFADTTFPGGILGTGFGNQFTGDEITNPTLLEKGISDPLLPVWEAEKQFFDSLGAAGADLELTEREAAERYKEATTR